MECRGAARRAAERPRQARIGAVQQQSWGGSSSPPTSLACRSRRMALPQAPPNLHTHPPKDADHTQPLAHLDVALHLVPRPPRRHNLGGGCLQSRVVQQRQRPALLQQCIHGAQRAHTPVSLFESLGVGVKGVEGWESGLRDSSLRQVRVQLSGSKQAGARLERDRCAADVLPCRRGACPAVGTVVQQGAGLTQAPLQSPVRGAARRDGTWPNSLELQQLQQAAQTAP